MNFTIDKLLSTGIVSALITAGVTWATNLGAISRRIRVLDEMTKRIAFWEAWGEAKVLGEPDDPAVRSKISNEAREAAEIVDKMYAELRVSPPISTKKSVPRWRRWLLLYPETKGWASAAKVFFFAVICCSPFLIIRADDGRVSAVVGCLLWIAAARFLVTLAERFA